MVSSGFGLLKKNQFFQQNNEQLDYLVLLDSNNHLVDWGVFWKNIPGKKEKIFCGSLFDIANRISNENHIRGIKYVIISIGVNDLDTKSAEDVVQQLRNLIQLLDGKYDQPKFVINEITPRLDEKDGEVKKCNALIKQFTD